MHSKTLQALAAVVILSLLSAGCWDRRELNDLAISLGWGIDKGEDGSYKGTAQFIMPSASSRATAVTPGKQFFNETAEAKTLLEITQRMQSKLSRAMFAGHRRVIFIGESLAKDGIKQLLDEYSRNPDVALRTDMYVVKGFTANELLQIHYPLEKLPSVGAYRIRQKDVPITTTLADLLITASGTGGSPTVPTITIESTDSHKTLRTTGRAIFDPELKLLGYVSEEESIDRLWILGKLKRRTFAAYMTEGNGYATFDGAKFSSKVNPVYKDGKMSIQVQLKSVGSVRENNSALDLKSSANIRVLEKAISDTITKHVTKTVQDIQKKYGTDVFGFGESVHRKYPKQWKSMKKTWASEFKNVEVSVTTDIKILHTGLVGPPMHLKEGAVKK